MTIDWISTLGAVVTLALGLLGLLLPARAAAFTQLSALGPSGFAEFRATFGGLFVGLGLMLLVQQSPVLFQAVGVAWLLTALGRVVSIVVDPGGRDRRNYAGVAFEALVGLLLLA